MLPRQNGVSEGSSAAFLNVSNNCIFPAEVLERERQGKSNMRNTNKKQGKTE